MSIRADRLAKLEARLDEQEQVRLVVILWADGDRPRLVGAIGGTPATTAAAIERWYKRHPDVEIKREHAAMLKEQGIRAPRRASKS
jgi:hypothetical protein